MPTARIVSPGVPRAPTSGRHGLGTGYWSMTVDATGNRLLGGSDMASTTTDAQELLTRVHDRHAPALRVYLGGFTRASGQGADDLLQETMIRVWRHLGDLPDEPEHARRWLFTVARNTGIDAVRRSRARPAGAQLPDILPSSADEVTGIVVAMDSLRTALRSLSSEHRRVLTELYVDGHTISQTAQRLGVPVGTVKSRSFYALRSLRTAMTGPDQSNPPSSRRPAPDRRLETCAKQPMPATAVVHPTGGGRPDPLVELRSQRRT